MSVRRLVSCDGHLLGKQRTAGLKPAAVVQRSSLYETVSEGSPCPCTLLDTRGSVPNYIKLAMSHSSTIAPTKIGCTDSNLQLQHSLGAYEPEWRDCTCTQSYVAGNNELHLYQDLDIYRPWFPRSYGIGRSSASWNEHLMSQNLHHAGSCTFDGVATGGWYEVLPVVYPANCGWGVGQDIRHHCILASGLSVYGAAIPFCTNCLSVSGPPASSICGFDAAGDGHMGGAYSRAMLCIRLQLIRYCCGDLAPAWLDVKLYLQALYFATCPVENTFYSSYLGGFEFGKTITLSDFSSPIAAADIGVLPFVGANYSLETPCTWSTCTMEVTGAA